MIIRQIRNATLKITYAGYTFLTDHWLSDKGTGFTCTQTFENDELSIGSIRIHRTEGIHGDNPDLIERMGKVSGFVLEAPDEKPLHIAGDTVYLTGKKTPSIVDKLGWG